MTDTLSEKPGKPAPKPHTPSGFTGRSRAGGEIPRRRRRRRVGLVALLSMVVLLLALAVAAFAVIGRPLIAPDWVKARIETQVNGQLSGVRIGLGEVSLVVEDVWHPRVHLNDVDIADAEGRHLLRLSDLDSTLALTPLIRGQVQPARIWLSGAQLVLRRDTNGQVALSFGEATPSASQAASFVELVGEIDRALAAPALADLRGVSAAGLTIRLEDARAQRAWTVDGGRVELIRDGDDLTLRGDFALLSGGSSAATVEMSYASQIGSPAATMGVSFADLAASDIAVQSAALLWLDVLRAPISGALRASTDDQGNLGPLSATLQIGEGVLQPTEETKPIPFHRARSYFTYSPDTQTMHVDEMSVDSAWGSARAEGKVVLGALENGLPKDFISQMQLSEIQANPKQLYPEPVAFSNATMDMRLELDPFRLTLGEMTLHDDDRTLLIGGELSAAAKGWDLSISGRLDQLGPDRLLQLWPESLVPNTRAWIERNVLDGRMHNVQIGLRSEPDQKPVTYLGFEFEDFSTLFMKSMPPIENARGHAVLFRNGFSVTADAGVVGADQGGRVDITGSVFHIPDVTQKQAPANVDLATRSTITAALSLLDREPFRFISKSGQKVTMANGTAQVRGRVDLALKKDLPAEEVKYDLRADLLDVRSESLVPGHVLAASRLLATADGRELIVSGKGRVGKVPVDGRFSAALGKENGGKSRVEGSVELSSRFVEEFRLGLPKGSVSGEGRGALRIDMQRGSPPTFALSSNLAGLAMRVSQIGWAMSRKARGTLEVAGKLGTPVEVNRIALQAPGLKTSGSLVLNRDGSFREARFKRVRAGRWLDAPVTLIGRGAGRAPEVRVSGGTVDLSQTEIGSGTGSGGTSGGGPLKVTLDRLRISEGIALTGFRGDFNTARGMDGAFSGRVNGGAPVTGRVIPQKGRSAFRIQSKNGGGVFQSAGLFKNARGGVFDLTLVPGGGPGSYDGLLKVTNIWLRDAPAMAALLNAISVVGLLEQLAGNGILFGEVEARFRLTPKMATITRSSAIGNSMGISMDGYYNLETGAMNMQGTLSPLYLLNGVGSILTRKGEGLVGFTYRLKGTADRPRVQVNPLSLLTPGMFREIFRRPPPKVSP